jgi:hypothetical protein
MGEQSHSGRLLQFISEKKIKSIKKNGIFAGNSSPGSEQC